MQKPSQAHANAQSWSLLLILSVLWGASFLFIGIAVKELPAMLIVLVRVTLAAAVLIPVHLIFQGPLPRDAKTWIAGGGMSIMNNIIPFSLIVYGQHFITAGLASVINATTPLFAVAVLAATGFERLTAMKITGLVLGLAGVGVLKGIGLADLNQETVGMLCVLGASFSYGASSPWAKKMLVGIPPLTTAMCQLTISSAIMAVLAFAFSNPSQLLTVSSLTWFALAGLAVVSTAIAYLLFFKIIALAGPGFVSLVTMVIPIPAIIMAALFLGERLTIREFVGAAIIGLALLVIDGRLFRREVAR